MGTKVSLKQKISPKIFRPPYLIISMGAWGCPPSLSPYAFATFSTPRGRTKTKTLIYIHMSTTTSTKTSASAQTFNIADLATQAPINATDLANIKEGDCLIGSIANVQPMQAINGKAVCRIYVHCPAFNQRFSSLLDGSLTEVLALKGIEITLIFRGINVVNGVSYPKFSTVF